LNFNIEIRWITYEANIEYLQKKWSTKEISNFVLSTDKKITILSGNPTIGKSRNKKFPHIRFAVIHKRVALIYKHKPTCKNISKNKLKKNLRS
jgi:hypothetical protein